MVEAIVFDLDGTHMNTLDDLQDSTNYALKQCGFDPRGYEEVRSFVGNGVRLLIERAVPQGTDKAQVEKCFEIFTKHYDKNMENKTRPYDGVEQMLEEVKKRGYKTAVVSNKYDSAVKKLVGERFGKYIGPAVGESATVKKKPSPDGVWAALESLGVKRESAVYVGDSDVDAMTAKNAGLRFVGVTWGFRDRELLESLGADRIIDNPSELVAAVESFA